MANLTGLPGAAPAAGAVASSLALSGRAVHSPQSFSAVFLAGILLHVFAFRLGEWDLQAAKLVAGFGLSGPATAVALAYLLPAQFPGVGAAAPTAVLLLAALVAGILASTLVYRGLFHRLRRFPGPVAARLSNLYATRLSLKRMHLYAEVQALHRAYGDIVRLGPSELSVNTPHAFAALHASQSPCSKGPWYNALHPMVSLMVVRDADAHAPRRKTWDKGFSIKALRDYEPRVAGHARQLLGRIDAAARAGQPLDVSDWFTFFSFDVMGDLAFGKSFGMLRDGVKHYFMKALRADMLAVGVFGHLMWLLPIFKATPILNREAKQFWTFVTSQVHERMENQPDRPDVFSWVLAEYKAIPEPTWQDTLNLYGDAYLIIVAGSDTTAVTLTCLFFELALHPEVLETLRAEVDEYYREHDEPDYRALAKLRYLQACVDETLRLHPPAPSGFQRMTPPEGMHIDNHFIPGDTIVQIPVYTMFRDERHFTQPNDFIPERWTTRPELTNDPSMFGPFSIGKFSCVGKQLALMELRYVVSQIVRKYDVALAPGQTAEAFTDGCIDAFTVTLAPLKLKFSPRAA